MPTTREDVERLAREHGLGRIAREIAEFARTAIPLKYERGEVPVGGSKLGGLPDLPTGAEWPIWRDRPLTLLAQISLEDVAPFDEEPVLPTSGHLLFFWDSVAVGLNAGGDPDGRQEGGWGFDPADAGSARVLYVPGGGLTRAAPPAGMPDRAVLSEGKIVPGTELTVPPWESSLVEPLGLGREEVDAYFDLVERLAELEGADRDDYAPRHQLLGHPDQIQGDMQLECQLVTNGLYAGDETGYDDPRAVELAGGAAEWRLLLQVGSDEDELGAMWGDVGRLYYWIREDDLRAGRFDAVWLILQCS